MKNYLDAIEAAKTELLKEKSVPESRIHSECNIAKAIFAAPTKQAEGLRNCNNYESIKTAVKTAVNTTTFSLDPSFAKEMFFEVRNNAVNVQYQWRAYAKLARLCGAAEDIRYTVVYNDEAQSDSGNGFVYDPIARKVIKHKYIPIKDQKHLETRGIYGVVASAVKSNGTQIDFFVELYRLDKRKAVAKTDMVWKAWVIEMYGKTAVKMLCNELFINISNPEHTAMAAAMASEIDIEEEAIEQANNRAEYNEINKKTQTNGNNSNSDTDFFSGF